MGNNRFYSDFDTSRRVSRESEEDEIRTPFQLERDRIIFSYAFRRLQSKTQVFQSGEFDFYRTRLTHSIEVAKIARSIAEYLNLKACPLKPDFQIDTDLVESIGLAHDLGHPPFGHIGERRLNALMGPYGGFEGNAQTLRILTGHFYARRRGNKGMNPTRALLDGILKYKTAHSALIREHHSGNPIYPSNHFIYDSDLPWLEFVFENNLDSVTSWCTQTSVPMNKFRSLECQIMDWADDTAYSINDIIDGIHAGYLLPQRLREWGEKRSLEKDQSRVLDELVTVILDSSYESFLNKQIGTFIHAAGLVERENPMSGVSNRYRFGITVDPRCRARADLYQAIAVDLIFQSPQIQRIEYKGGLMLEAMFHALAKNYLEDQTSPTLNLIPARLGELIQETTDPIEKARILCDSVAEMTDSLAIRTYKQLFDPDFGSILDIV